MRPMTLAFYFFRQFVPPFLFGSVMFLFVLLLDRLFDIIDLVFNKGVAMFVVAKLFGLFIPTVIPLTLPMACLLACLVTFGRLSEENELSAVRAAGISLFRVLWIPPFFALTISLMMIPFNTRVAPWANRGFRTIYEQIANADPLISVQPRRFFSVKNIKLFALQVDKKSQQLKNLFVYQISDDGRPPERIFAKIGELKVDPDAYHLDLMDGQLERYDATAPKRLVHTAFDSYRITLPINRDAVNPSTRFRNFSSRELTRMIDELKKQKMPTGPLRAERSLRIAIAFAPLALAMMGIPLATALRRGGRGFGFGVSVVVIFSYYTLLIFGLTMAEKSILPSDFALWIANGTCFLISSVLIVRLLRQ